MIDFLHSTWPGARAPLRPARGQSPCLVLWALIAITGCGPPAAKQKMISTVESLGGDVTIKDGRLVKIDLSSSRASDADLAALGNATHLERLYLNSAITDQGLVHLAGLTNLSKLDLQKTQVTDAGLEHLKKLPNLQQLYVHGSRITEAGMADLEAALPRLTIERFPISQP